MKNIFKKVSSIVMLFVLPFFMIQTSYTFQHMDVCNYTYWDYSGDYYDRLCTEDGKPSEDTPKYSSNTNTVKAATTVKEKKTHDLKYVNHRMGWSFPFGTSSSETNIDREIAELKKQLHQNNLLLEEYKKNNSVQTQEILVEQNRTQALPLEQSATKSTPVKKTTIYRNTPMEDTIMNKDTAAELIRQRIERLNLRNNR